MTSSVELKCLLSALLRVSEKAANIARVIRSERALFDLLVEEKTGATKNKRFVRDFKTLGDVLVQETVRHDLGKQFDGLAANIRGEESNSFTNTLGQTVTIQLGQTPVETAQLLVKVLDGNEEAGSILAKVAHQEVTIPTHHDLETCEGQVNIDDIGIWIDPIDSTAQYILGIENSSPHPSGVYPEGLQCALVLIGVYSLRSGKPIAGVVNQPFSQYNVESQRWIGRYVCGLSYGSTNLHFSNSPPAVAISQSSAATSSHACHTLVISSSELVSVQGQLAEGQGFKLVHVAGAGYKMLCVADGLVAGYVLTQGSTFAWDSCAPHALLVARGGGIVDYQKAVGVARSHPEILSDEADMSGLNDRLEGCQVVYHGTGERATGAERWSNAGGIIAYSNTAILAKILQKLL